MNSILSSTIKLPCGVILKNRIAKSAMSENMSTPDHQTSHEMAKLYDQWARGGSGLLITGNIMIDSTALGEPGNVVIEKNRKILNLDHWVKSGTLANTHLWAQLNHPGKQSPKFLSPTPVAPSAIELKSPLNKMFNKPRALEELEITNIIEGFAFAAKTLKASGFTGIQIHGAHGYLVSQFLSPLHNQRNDKWGGTLENRMRFVTEIYRAIRREVGAHFPISIKLNSADFQKGGFSEEESIDVAKVLDQLKIDLIEISGGTYEAPVMTGLARQKASTIAREAYFLEYCEKIKNAVNCPIMLTGGFRTLGGMNLALEKNACDIIGLGRSLAVNPNFPSELLHGINNKSQVKTITTGIKFLDKIFPLEITWYGYQLHRMGSGKKPNPNLNVFYSILWTIINMGFKNIKRVRSGNTFFNRA